MASFVFCAWAHRHGTLRRMELNTQNLPESKHAHVALDVLDNYIESMRSNPTHAMVVMTEVFEEIGVDLSIRATLNTLKASPHLIGMPLYNCLKMFNMLYQVRRFQPYEQSPPLPSISSALLRQQKQTNFLEEANYHRNVGLHIARKSCEHVLCASSFIT